MIRQLLEITVRVAVAPVGAIAAFFLENIFAIALLLLRFFLRSRSRLRSALAPVLCWVISTSVLRARREMSRSIDIPSPGHLWPDPIPRNPQSSAAIPPDSRNRLKPNPTQIWSPTNLFILQRSLGLLLSVSTVSLLFFVACEDTERTEARALLKRLQSIDIRLPVNKRQIELSQLESLVLNEKELDRARDHCVRAHKALIAAEVEQERAKRILDKATALDPNVSIDDPDFVVIAEAIERSNSELKRAKDIFPGCEREIRKLELRFASSRRLR